MCDQFTKDSSIKDYHETIKIRSWVTTRTSPYEIELVFIEHKRIAKSYCTNPKNRPQIPVGITITTIVTVSSLIETGVILKFVSKEILFHNWYPYMRTVKSHD